MSKHWTPHQYQKRAVKFMISQACAALFCDMGTGKSSITLAAIKLLKEKGYINKTLIIAPLRVAHAVWPAEAAKWEEFAHLRVVVLHGPKKQEALAGEWDIAVINPEGLSWLFANLSKKGVEWPFDVLVCDESTLFKNARTERFKALKPHLSKFRRRYILTGTPAPNGLIDLFGQIYLLDGGNALGAHVTHYRLKFFMNPDGQGWEWKPRPGAEAEIYEALKPLVLRMSAEDYLDLPEIVFNEVVVELPPKARTAYDQMEAVMLTQIGTETVVAANAAAVTGKCRQIAGGGIYTSPGEGVGVHTAKLDAVEEIVESLQGQPVIVVYEFDHERVRLQERFKGAPFIGGGVSTAEFMKIEREWNEGRIPVMLVQPQSAGLGLNLNRGGHHMVFHSTTWDLALHDQVIARLHRQGQTERVFVHYIVAKDTVDAVVLKMLARKDRTQKALLNALRDYSKEIA